MRNIQDAELIKTVALPAAGSSAQTASVDFGAAGPAALENVEVELSLPDLPNLADAKSVTLTVEDSADDSSFAAVALLGTTSLTGAGGTGATGSSWKFRLPSNTRRYVRADAAVEAAGGDNTSQSLTMKVLT